MRHLKILVLATCSLALCFGAAVAGMNPNDFGLAGGVALYNPMKSRICTDCHTRIPGSPTVANGYGSHFVTAGAAHDTQSGGGWTGSKNGVRTGGQFFRLNAWPIGGTYSKYGGTGTDNTSYYTAATDNQAGLAISSTTLTAYTGATGREMICESCHNVVKNVAGGNNLVAPLTAVYSANGAGAASAVQVTNWQNGDDSPLCVGCHGFMYSAYKGPSAGTTANDRGTRIGDTRNQIDGGTALRDVNHSHTINGVGYHQNHHVMAGDSLMNTWAADGVYWADTLVKDEAASGWGNGGSALSTTAAASAPWRGTMPMLGTWNTDGGKVKGGATNFTCVSCHNPHFGDLSAGASILRDTDSASSTGAAATAVSKLSETPRGWMTINDQKYCNDCHTLAIR